jgi:hypothetical protein
LFQGEQRRGVDGGVQDGLEDLALSGDEDPDGVEGASHRHAQPRAQDEAGQEGRAGLPGLRPDRQRPKQGQQEDPPSDQSAQGL